MSNSGTEQNVLFYFNSVITIVIVVFVVILILREKSRGQKGVQKGVQKGGVHVLSTPHKYKVQR